MDKTKNPKKSVNGLVFLNPKKGGGFELRLNDKGLVIPEYPPDWYKDNFFSSEVPFYYFKEEENGDIVPYNPDEENKSIILTSFALFDLNSWDCQTDFLHTSSKLQEVLKTGAFVVLACVCLFVTFIIATELNKPKVPGPSIQTTYQEVR
jgi:hypothetical protein